MSMGLGPRCLSTAPQQVSSPRADIKIPETAALPTKFSDTFLPPGVINRAVSPSSRSWRTSPLYAGAAPANFEAGVFYPEARLARATREKVLRTSQRANDRALTAELLF